ncbi:MAG TPA: ATP-binding protein [Pseudonocardiaceae bacterium]|nr:ATP-binding protein [Pseudonocardiaceae bacterium]
MMGRPWLTCGEGTGPPGLRLEVRGDPTQLLPLRRALRAWLQSTGASADDVTAIQIAAGEAAANAVEHGYLGVEPGPVWLSADLEPGNVIKVEVGDAGRWRPQRHHRSNGRGRGLLLMRECVDEVSLSRSPRGTTVVLRLRLGVDHP